MNPYGVPTQSDPSGSYNQGQLQPYARPGWWRSANQLFNPFARDPIGGNPIENNQEYAGTLGGKPIDGAAWITQRIAAPLAGMYIANQIGMSTLGRSIGGGLAGGLARGVGLGSVAGGASFIGGGLGGLVAPIAGGIALAEGFNQGFIQPYSRSILMADQARRNFQGISFPNAMGNVVSGRGLSFSESARVGVGIESLAWRDKTFSNDQFHNIASMGMRAGLFDDAQSGQITKRVKEIASQVKLLMSISKELNESGAISQLAQLRLGGASLNGGMFSQAARAYSSIGMSASIAGMSAQGLLATGGAMGASAYQSYGLTPYLGALAGANTMSSFAAAERLGIMSSAHLARFGGVQGAAAGSLGVQLAGQRTPYNQMRMFNQFMNGGGQSSLTGDVLAFSREAARDPSMVRGAMGLYGRAMQEAQMRIEGSAGLENQALRYMQSHHRRPGPGGKYDVRMLADYLENAMGLPPEEVEKYIAQRATETNPAFQDAARRGIRSQTIEQVHSYVSQNSLNPTWAGKLARSGKEFAYGSGGFLHETVAAPIARMRGAAQDATQEIWNTLTGDVTGSTDLIDVSKIEAGRDASMSSLLLKGWAWGAYEMITGSARGKERDLYNELNQAAKNGGARGDLAREIVNKPNDPETRKKLAMFAKTSDNAAVRSYYEEMKKSPEALDKVVKGIVAGTKPENTNVAQELANITQDGKLSTMDQLKLIGQANMFTEELNANGGILRDNLDMLKQDKYSMLRSAIGGLNEHQQTAYLQSVARGSLENDYAAAASLVASGQAKSVDDVRRAFGGKLKSGIRARANIQNLDDASGLLGIFSSSASSLWDKVRGSNSEFDFSTYTQTLENISRMGKDTAETNMSAAVMFRDAVDKFRGTGNSPMSYSQSTQNVSEPIRH